MQLYIPQNYMTSHFGALSASSPVPFIVRFLRVWGGKNTDLFITQCPLPAVLTGAFNGKN